MGRIVVRSAGYTGFLQQLTWVQGNNIPGTAHLWGGAGGGGGNDSNAGGSGSGGGYTQVQFTINEGDVFVLDMGVKIYYWAGKDCNGHETLKALEIA